MGPKDPKDLGNSMIRAQGHPKGPKLIAPWGRMLAHAGPKLFGEPDDSPPPLMDHEEAGPKVYQERPKNVNCKGDCEVSRVGQQQ